MYSYNFIEIHEPYLILFLNSLDSRILSILSKKFPNENFPPVIIHISYLLSSLAFCLLYKLLIIAGHDFYNNEYSSIYKVLNGEALHSMQYRVLIPYLFKGLSSVLPLSDIPLFMLMTFVITYLTLLCFRSVLNVYFENKTLNSIAAIIIFYPMIWNFMLLNTIFFFVDSAIVLFMTAGFYCIITKKNYWLLIIILFATLNHYSSAFIIMAFVLFNYKTIFKKQTFIFAAALSAVFLCCLLAFKLKYPYFPPERDDGFVMALPKMAISAITDLPRGILLKYIFLNFGGLHLLALLVIVTGLWKKIRPEFLAIFLFFVPYCLIAMLRLGIRLEEMRNWIPLIPFVTVIALILFAGLKNPLFALSGTVLKEK